MKKKEMADLIFEMLGGVLSGTEFRLKKSEEGFVRKIPNGRQMVGLPLWDYQPRFEFSLNICIRLDAVEEVFHKFSGATPNYHAMSFTTTTCLTYFTRGPERYNVTTAQDVASVGGILSHVIRDKIVPFFNEHEDVLALDRTINRKRSLAERVRHLWSRSGNIDTTQDPWGAMHKIIIAHLAGNTNFERMVLKHRFDMGLRPGVDHPFNRLVEFLRREQADGEQG